MSSRGGKKLIAELLRSTSAKISNGGQIEEEYHQVEDVGPAPRNAWGQHDAMVAKGVCKAAVKHEERNRYCNLFPFDSHRVVLEKESPDDVDYINGSWVRVSGVESEFILTMAPLDPGSGSTGRSYIGSDTSVSTCEEFWRMVEQTNSELIVMICKIEKGFTGCSQYFPSRDSSPSLTFGRVSITLVGEVAREEEGVVERELEVTMRTEGSTTPRRVKHLQFVKWPNYGVVENINLVTQFVKKVHSIKSSLSTPMIVHCSGGIGRSGTFTTVYSIYHLLNIYEQTGSSTGLEKYTGDDGAICLTDLVKEMREQRHPWMVEGLHQYSMAYQAVLGLLQTNASLGDA